MRTFCDEYGIEISRWFSDSEKGIKGDRTSITIRAYHPDGQGSDYVDKVFCLKCFDEFEKKIGIKLVTRKPLNESETIL